MLALIVRAIGPLQQEPAHAAQQIVMWYAGRLWTLWVLLFALPLAVLGIGSAALLGHSATLPQALASLRADRSLLLATALTFVAGVILIIVGLHVMMN